MLNHYVLEVYFIFMSVSIFGYEILICQFICEFHLGICQYESPSMSYDQYAIPILMCEYSSLCVNVLCMCILLSLSFYQSPSLQRGR